MLLLRIVLFVLWFDFWGKITSYVQSPFVLGRRYLCAMVWERYEQQALSIVIPALNEQDNIQNTLIHTAGFEPGERIVVDGGSSDGTVALLKA